MFGEPQPVDTDLCRSRFLANVKNGDSVEMEKRITLGIDVNFCDKPGRDTPLHIAVRQSDFGAVQILLDANANVSALDAQNNTALHLSIMQNNIDITELLLQTKVPLESCDCRGDTALVKASRFASSHVHIPLLLKYNCRVDALNPHSGRTPLHFVIDQKCDPAVLLQLLVRWSSKIKPSH